MSASRALLGAFDVVGRGTLGDGELDGGSVDVAAELGGGFADCVWAGSGVGVCVGGTAEASEIAAVALRWGRLWLCGLSSHQPAANATATTIIKASSGER